MSKVKLTVMFFLHFTAANPWQKLQKEGCIKCSTFTPYVHSLQKMVYYLPLWRHDTIYPNLTSFTLGVKHAKTPQGPTIDSCRWLLKATHSFTSKLLISSYKKLVKLQDDTSFLKEASKLGALFVHDKDSPHISLKMGNRIHLSTIAVVPT